MNDSDDVRYRQFKDEKGPTDGRSTTTLRENGETSTQVLDNTFSTNEPHLDPLNELGGSFDDREPILGDSSDDREPRIVPEYTGGCGFFCNPQSICHKGIALALMCSVGFGSYFCYDNPGALQVNQT